MTTSGNGQIKYRKPVFRVTRDTEHLPPWKRTLYWRVFVPLLRVGFRLGLPVLIDKNGARLDIQSVADTDAIASAIVAQVGGESFYIPNVPCNVTLPTSTVVFGGNRAPYSEVAHLYNAAGKREDVAILCPITKNLCTEHETVKISTVEDLYHQVKTLAAS